MCCRATVGARLGLMLTNLLLMLVALACVGCGVVLILGRALYGSQLGWLQDELRSFNTKLDVSQLDVTFVTLPLGAALITVGFLIAVVCILGIIAASGHFYKLTLVYLVVLSCLFFAESVVVICSYIDRTPFDSTVKVYMKSSLSGYKGDSGADSTSLGWNAVMLHLKCCGVDSYADFTSWSKTTANQVIPGACCVKPFKGDPCSEKSQYNQPNMTYYDRGCYNLVWDYVTSNTGLIIFDVFFIVVLQFLNIFFTVWIICQFKSRGFTRVGVYRNMY
ncbi:tetraspanin-9-like [Physella acuta]|uniref:tetraspanin-9-like n=1 Tax=Physella acuta TaxID=109671 RepID=UPI0027DC8FF2|nr:tetraspanin-9-like [Physella acuta]